MNKEIKLDELLSLRSNLKQNIDRISDLIEQGIRATKNLPYRWMIVNDDSDEFNIVIEFLISKGFTHLQVGRQAYGCGYGIIDGQFLFVPADCVYSSSTEITLDEFKLALKMERNDK